MSVNYKKIITGSVLSISAAFLLAGCDQADSNQTAGQKLDSTLATVEQKTDNFMASAEAKTEQMANDASQKLDEAATTAAINAELMKDEKLSAVKINVDTYANKVILSGTAPDAASKERATVIAKNAEGVVEVDNQLTISTQ